MKPEITSENIISLLSSEWLKVNEIVDIMGIKNPLDSKYLIIRLNDLYQKGKIVYIYHLNVIYWKLNKDEYNNQINLPLDFFSEMVEKDPNDIDAWNELGFLYFDSLQYNEAIDCFEAVINLDPFDAITWAVLGSSYHDLEQIESAIKCQENALRVIDYDLELRGVIITSISLVSIYLEQYDYNNSLKILYRLLDVKEELKLSELVLAYNLMAINFTRKHEFIKGFEFIEKALSILPESKMTEETIEIIKIFILNYKNKYGVSPFKTEDRTEMTEFVLEIIKKVENSYLYQSDKPLYDKDNQYREIKDSSIQIIDELKGFRKSFEKSSEKRDILLIKSYIDNFIQFFFEKPSKKQIEKLKASLEGVLKGFPDDMWDLVSEEYNNTLERYKLLMPKKWKKWGRFLIKLLPVILT